MCSLQNLHFNKLSIDISLRSTWKYSDSMKFQPQNRKEKFDHFIFRQL